MLIWSITALMLSLVSAPYGLLLLFRWKVQVENSGLPDGWWYTSI